MDEVRLLVLIAATITMGLMAGLFAAFSYAVMPGLARTDARTFVAAMQRINEAILNGWFAIAIGGAVVFTTAAALMHLPAQERPALPWIVAALVLYLIALVVTGVVNVPLNNGLLAEGPPDRITDPAAARRRFERRWVRWNVARSVLTVAALGCLCGALIRSGATAAGG